MDNQDGKPEEKKRVEITGNDFLMGVLNGRYKIRQKNFKAKMEAAKALIGYERPRLNTVDATVRTVEMTHEEWINEIDNEKDDDDDK